jgi:hypothetical protein
MVLFTSVVAVAAAVLAGIGGIEERNMAAQLDDGNSNCGNNDIDATIDADGIANGVDVDIDIDDMLGINERALADKGDIVNE